MSRLWSEEDKQLLRDHYVSAPREWLEGQLKRPWEIIFRQAYRLGIGPRIIHRTEEAKRKLSESTRGRPKPVGFGAKISAAKKGKKNSLEHCAAMSRARKAMGLKTWLGRHHTEETKRLISKKKRLRPVDDTRFWPNNSQWRTVAAQVRERDGDCCLICGTASGKQAHPVHHIVPYRVVREHHPNNLITLCRLCHFWVERWMLWDYCADIMVLKHGIDPREMRYSNGAWDMVIGGNAWLQ